MSKTLRAALAVVVVVLIAGGAGVWYFVLRDTAQTQASLDAIGSPSTTGSNAGPGAAPASTTSAAGSWKVKQDQGVFVGYRVDELFAGDRIKKTATGRTPTVEGTMTVTDKAITVAQITADVSQLKSDETQRDNAIRSRGLETQKFPQATFKLTEPIALTTPPAKDQEISLTATGELTLHGVTKPVKVPLKAKWTGTTITVATEGSGLPIVFADYGMTAITVPLVTTDDRGTLELQLLFVPA